MVAIGNVYTAPWALLQLVTVPLKRELSRVPLFSMAWEVRGVVFAAVLVTSAKDGRGDGFAGVSAITALSWSTPRLEAAWVRVAGRLADAGLAGAVSAQRRAFAGRVTDRVPTAGRRKG